MRVFTPIDDEIMRRSDLSFGAKCTYARLLRYSKGGRCNPSHETLGRELGRSVAQVKKYIRQLEDRGIVMVEKTGRGRGHSSHYVILPPEKVSWKDRKRGHM